MQHVFWLKPAILGGRTGPNRDTWDPKALVDGGIGAVLSVNKGELVQSDDLIAAGILYKCVPLPGSEPPQPGDLERCIEALPKALDFIFSTIDSGRCTIVHCTSGKDRTGMLLSYYLCETEDLDPEEAIQKVKQVRPTALSAEGWEDLAVEVLRALAK